MVVRVDADEVGEDVLARQREVLDDKVDLLVGVLNTRNGDVAKLVDERRQNLVADIAPELGLELETALAVEEQVPRKACPVLAEPARRALEYESTMSYSQ